MSWFDSSLWLPAFVRAGLVSEPLIWGKLPSRADYVQHNLRHDQIAPLQEWIRAQMPEPAPVTAIAAAPMPTALPGAARKKRDPQAMLWHSLVPAPQVPATCAVDAQPVAAASHNVLPWCFVLPPGTLSFARKQHLIGVWMESSDKIGRRYPMVMLQSASARWVKQYFSRHAAQPCDWLYFAARCLAQAIYAEETEQDRPSYPKDDHAAVLVQKLAQLWALYRPGWSEALGRGTVMVAATHAQDIVGAAHPEDVVGSFDGVRYLPWADWPQRLTARAAQPVFWQQDLRGRFVDAAQALPTRHLIAKDR